MSYRQAFHTSCRKGLSGHAGFQFNAASHGLDDEQLARLAGSHAGYHAAPDAPLEPNPADIERLPVSLRYAPVDGLGPVVSQTAYVGREFRGAGDEPDSGRFGNYFSHIVVGAGGDGGFDGLLPIELWQAPHWSTTESATTELPALARIEPGSIDLDRVLVALLPERGTALATVADACLRAVLGGPRVVIVEPEPELAPAWVAWASFILPPERVAGLTFATFDGRPRVAEVRLCVTTPSCEVDFASYELGTTAVVIDATAPAAGVLSLYARVVSELAGSGADGIAAAIRELDPGLDLEAAGARLAVAGRCTGLAGPEEVQAVIAALRGQLGRVPDANLATMAELLPSTADDPESTAEWSRLYAEARMSADPDAVGLVDEALRRLLDSAETAAGVAVEVERAAPVAPSVGALAAWLEQVSDAVGSERLGSTVALGNRLGLVGCNTALDKELAAAIATSIEDPAVCEAYDQIAAGDNDRVVECVALDLAAAMVDGAGTEALRRVAAAPAARVALKARAEEDGGFEAVAAWELLRCSEDTSRRAAAVEMLAGLATTDRQAELVRGLYGDRGPTSAAEHAELLSGWAAADRSAPPPDCRRALECLGELPLQEGDATASALFGAVSRVKRLRAEPAYLPWWLAMKRPPQGRDFRGWAGVLAKSRRALAALPAPRMDEVRLLAAAVAVSALDEDGYAEGLEALLDTLGPDWALDLGDALARSLAVSVDPERRLARAFVEWAQATGHRRGLIEAALPRGARDLSPKRLEAVGERLGDRDREEWEQWVIEHPPRRAMSRAVRGVLRRDERE